MTVDFAGIAGALERFSETAANAWETPEAFEERWRAVRDEVESLVEDAYFQVAVVKSFDSEWKAKAFQDDRLHLNAITEAVLESQVGIVGRDLKQEFRNRLRALLRTFYEQRLNLLLETGGANAPMIDTASRALSRFPEHPPFQEAARTLSAAAPGCPQARRLAAQRFSYCGHRPGEASKTALLWRDGVLLAAVNAKTSLQRAAGPANSLEAPALEGIFPLAVFQAPDARLAVIDNASGDMVETGPGLQEARRRIPLDGLARQTGLEIISGVHTGEDIFIARADIALARTDILRVAPGASRALHAFTYPGIYSLFTRNGQLLCTDCMKPAVFTVGERPELVVSFAAVEPDAPMHALPLAEGFALHGGGRLMKLDAAGDVLYEFDLAAHIGAPVRCNWGCVAQGPDGRVHAVSQFTGDVHVMDFGT